MHKIEIEMKLEKSVASLVAVLSVSNWTKEAHIMKCCLVSVWWKSKGMIDARKSMLIHPVAA